MAKKKATQSPDYLLLIIVAALLVIGLIMVYSSSYALGCEEYDQPPYFFQRQIIWAVLGTIGLMVMMRIDYHNWRRFSIFVMLVTVLMLVAVLIFGSERFGAIRSFFKGSVQPGEVAKLAVIIYIAHWLSSKGERIRQVTYGLIPFAILIGVIAGLILLQPDFSTAALIVLTAMAMFFIAGADLVQLLIGSLFGGAASTLLITRVPYRLQRIIAFIHSLSDPSKTSYHVLQSLIALARGGIMGQGLSESLQKLGNLPAPHTDTIFAVLGEELGLIGCLVVVGLFAALAYRGFKIALEAPDAFGLILASGITCWLIFQAVINIAVVTSTMPFAGLPLPFISFGGSSLVTSLTGVGLLLSISKSKRKAGKSNASFYFGWRDRRPRLSRSRRR